MFGRFGQCLTDCIGPGSLADLKKEADFPQQTCLNTVADKVVLVNPFDAFVHSLKCYSIAVSSRLCTARVIDCKHQLSVIIQCVGKWY